MKKSMDIIGLPIISISEGKELGKVKSFVINAAAGEVVALVVDDGKWYYGAKLLPFSAITGVGEYAVTLESSDYLLSVASNPEFEALLVADVRVIGSKVLTKAGRIQGKVTEIIVDDAGKIAVCEVEETSGEIIHIPAYRVLTFGKEVLIVASEEEPAAVVAPIIKAAESVSKPVVEELPVASTTIPQAQVAAAEPVVASPAAKEAANEDSSKKFDEKHRKYLLGKKASRRIETDNGMVIVEQGGEITEEVLQKAKLAGKFVELSMNIQ